MANIMEFIGYAPALCKLSKNVVRPKPSNPRGAGLAVLSFRVTKALPVFRIFGSITYRMVAALP